MKKILLALIIIFNIIAFLSLFLAIGINNNHNLPDWNWIVSFKAFILDYGLKMTFVAVVVDVIAYIIYKK
ncbi:hypothetical protein AWH56_008960 [Anaerobacillus isosaccharinicus]|uniref:Uncharacterized protein n=1 Tax=Anaerobacillus isosaccharinicus TaxID=1532552 RepID=A0A1S2KYC3_9BACI|nr:hypothetical protein [Anaerobacillus isosaccharinicus]QOY37691.1 hypothetical protein AWH56_008960 [Anaerobacillus isosaccharinicus]